MAVQSKGAPISPTYVKNADIQEASIDSGTFSGKKTTCCNPFKVILKGLIWLGEQIGEFFKSIRERCCSCCATDENARIPDPDNDAGGLAIISEPTTPNQQHRIFHTTADDSLRPSPDVQPVPSGHIDETTHSLDDSLSADPTKNSSQSEPADETSDDMQQTLLKEPVSPGHADLTGQDESRQPRPETQQILDATVLLAGYKFSLGSQPSIDTASFTRTDLTGQQPFSEPSSLSIPESHTTERTTTPQTTSLPMQPSMRNQDWESKSLDEQRSAHSSLSIKPEMEPVASEPSVDQPKSLQEAGACALELCQDIDDSRTSSLAVDSLNSLAEDYGYEEITGLYKRIKDLETDLMDWSRKLSLDTSKEEWLSFEQEIESQCRILLAFVQDLEKTPNNWLPTIFHDTDKESAPYQYIARMALVLLTFPNHDEALRKQYEDMHPNDHIRLRNKILTRLDEIRKRLKLKELYIESILKPQESMLKPQEAISFTVENQGSKELALDSSDVEKMQQRMSHYIIHKQVSAAEKETDIDPSSHLPTQFVTHDLPRNDYHVIDDEGITIALIRPDKEQYEKTEEFHAAQAKRNSEVIAYVKQLNNNPAVQQKVCHYLTQNPLIALLHGVEMEFIWPLFGDGFTLPGDDGFKMTVRKEKESEKDKKPEKIIIQYSISRFNATIQTPTLEPPDSVELVLKLEDIDARWGQSLIKCEISVVIDPDNLDNITTQDFMVHIDFPIMPKRRQTDTKDMT